MRIARYLISWGLFALSLLSLWACEEGQEPSTPLLPVYLEVSLQASQYRPLRSPGSIVLVKQGQSVYERLGYGGLALVHGLQLEAFYAFDLSCPYENRADIRLMLSREGLQLRCPECTTEYDVLEGTGAVLSGVGRNPLRRYSTRYDAMRQELRVSN